MDIKKKIIYFNGRFLAQPRTGVQRFAEELLTEFDQLIGGSEYSEHSFICLVPPEKDALRSTNWQNIQIRTCGRLKANLWEQIDLPFHARNGLLVDLCNIGPIFHLNQIALIYDASVFAVPDAYSWTFRLKYKFVFFVLSCIARRLLTTSQFSKKELSHYLHISENRFQVISGGCEHILQVPADDSLLDEYSLRGKPYFLAVGTSSRHKNLNAIIKAMQTYGDQLPNLVIAGGNFSKIFHDEELIADDKVIHLGFVTDGQLRSLYENALAFVFPSLYEGFGLPPLEAMACGCPVIASNRASIIEVCGDGALFVDSTDIEQIRSAMQRIVDSEELRAELQKKGSEQAILFTWNKAALEFLQIIDIYGLRKGYNPKVFI